MPPHHSSHTELLAGVVWAVQGEGKFGAKQPGREAFPWGGEKNRAFTGDCRTSTKMRMKHGRSVATKVCAVPPRSALFRSFPAAQTSRFGMDPEAEVPEQFERLESVGCQDSLPFGG